MRGVGEGDEGEADPAISLEIDGELDLHTFAPSDVASLVPDYLDECVARGIAEVRIVHGKGRGTLRRIVHAALDRHPEVASYQLAGGARGGWGATLVWLRMPARGGETGRSGGQGAATPPTRPAERDAASPVTRCPGEPEQK
jgi:hypothetical protein